jgi:hypothetical protein
MTTNKVITADTATEFEQKLNEVNKELGARIFATQTHVMMTAQGPEYTAVFFVRE